MKSNSKKILFYTISIIILFVIMEILSSFFLLKRYSSKNLIRGLEKKNSHFIYLVSKLYDKSLKKLNLKEEKVKKPFYDKFFLYPSELVKYEEWDEILENIFEDNKKNIKKQLTTYQKLLFNYRTPTLDYIFTNKDYNLSSYDKEVLDFNDYQRVSYKNNSNTDCWVFGGSTLFGDILKNQQTITSQLNKVQSKYNFINYGLPGYNSNLQLRYMINLLKIKKNELPSCVIFFDGINDSIDFTKFPLIHPVERSADPKILFNTPTSSTGKKQDFNMEYLPFGNQYNDKINNLLKYNFEELSKQTVGIQFYLRDNKLKIYDNDIMIKLSVENFIDNGIIAEGILKGIDDKIIFIRYLQPNPFLDINNNPFLKKEYQNSNIYNYVDKFYNKLKKNYRNEFIDLSNLINTCSDNCYVDPGHYSPHFIRKIAKNIIEELK